MREWLRTLRKQKGYSQEFMGLKLGVSRQQYNFIESMERQKDLKLSHAIAISKVLKISLKRIREYEEALKDKRKEVSCKDE